MRNFFLEPLIEKHKDIIRKDNCMVSEVFEILLFCCNVGLLLVSFFHHGYGVMFEAYIAYGCISLILYFITHFYVRKHLQYSNMIMFIVIIVSYTYAIFSGIVFNIHSPSITVYSLMVAACSAYFIPVSITYVLHSFVGVIYSALAIVLKPEYGVQDTINYIFFLSMSFVLTTIIYRTRLEYLKTIDKANAQKNSALERIQMQKELNNNRKKEQTLIAGIPGGVAIYRMKKDGHILTDYVSDGLAKMCGYDDVDEFFTFLRNDPLPNVVPEDIPILLDATKKSLETHGAISIMYHIHVAGSENILIRLDANLIDSEMGEDDLAVWYGVHTRVSDESKEILKTQKLLKELTDQVPVGIGIYEIRDGKVFLQYVNDAYYSMLGDTREDRADYCGIDTTKAVHPDDMVHVNAAINSLVSGENSAEVTYRLKVGTDKWFWVHLSIAVIDRNEEYIKIYAAFTDFNENMMARQKLEKSEKTLQIALDSAQVMAWRYDYKTYCITDSNILGRMYNLPKVIENVPQAIVDAGFVAKDSESDFYKLYEDMKKYPVASADIKAVDGRGREAWFKQIYTQTFDSDGNYVDSIGIAINITKQKFREQRYEEIIQLNKAATKDAIVIASYNLSQNKVTDYNSKIACLEYLESYRTADDLLERTKLTVLDIDEQDKFKVAENVKTLIDTFVNGTDHVEIIHHMGDSLRWYETTFDMIRNPYTGDIEAISALNDVTDKVRAELVANQLIDVDYQSIMLIDVKSGKVIPFVENHSDGNLDEMMELEEKNNSAQIALEEFLKRYAVPGTAGQAISENSLPFIIDKLKNDDYFETMYTLNQDEKKATYRVMYSYLRNQKDTILCAVQDVTDMYEKEEKQKSELAKALNEAEAANNAKTAFLSRVSHDMRTPLNGILGLTTILKEDIKDEKSISELNELEMSGKYLLNLINDTLDVSRIESGKMELHPEVCDGKEIYENTISLIKTNMKKKRLHLITEVDKLSYPKLYIDVGRIEQIVMNVVGNAVKFTPEGGTINISVKNISYANGVIKNEIIIEDNGIGMSPKFVPHIFEAFAQEDETRTSLTQGTGLGMSITKQILEIMGGDIKIESRLGKGTKATIIIPMQIATKEQIKDYEKSLIGEIDEEFLVGKRVLLCEDHPLNTIIATKLLEAKKLAVTHAENGKIGVETFEKSDVNYFDVILMDIRMPVMDGIDATKAIRALDREDAHKIPIIAMTANALAGDVQQTKESGMNEHLSKPIDTEILYSTLERLIKQRD